MVSKRVDSSAWICVGHVTITSSCHWLEGTSTTIANVEKSIVSPKKVNIVACKKFLIIDIITQIKISFYIHHQAQYT